MTTEKVTIYSQFLPDTGTIRTPIHGSQEQPVYTHPTQSTYLVRMPPMHVSRTSSPRTVTCAAHAALSALPPPTHAMPSRFRLKINLSTGLRPVSILFVSFHFIVIIPLRTLKLHNRNESIIYYLKIFKQLRNLLHYT